MYANARASEQVAVLATIDPASQAAGTAATAWIPVTKFARLLAYIDVGAFGASATVDANLQQAQDNAGTGAKAITNKAITQLLAAGGNNRQAMIDLRDDEVDVNNGFSFVKLNVIVGTAATQTAAALLGFVPRQGLASDSNQAGVAQIVP